ncbi:hypothetical protein AMECASPLE_024762 [Ameca splendens]|uniref:Uncharacterized protein n=1 Tax=Ameca splendens TaxID=208324 RepID=A0ABV1ABX2_9TELE
MRLGVSGHTQNPSPCQLINSCPPPYSPPSTLFTLPPSPFSFFHPPPCSPSLRISSPLRRPRTQRFFSPPVGTAATLDLGSIALAWTQLPRTTYLTQNTYPPPHQPLLS